MVGVKEVQTPKARLLGAELRDLRDTAGLTVRDLAKLLDVAQATVSRYERGERAPKPEYVARVLGTLGISGARYDEIVDFAITASEPNMIVDGSKGLHRHLIEISEFERVATRVVHVAPLVVPGIVQTRSYARAVMALLAHDERDVRVELRMARRESLAAPHNVEIIVAERALKDALGGNHVMLEQLDYMIEVAQRLNVMVRVLPADFGRWTVAHDGAFVLYEFSKASSIIHLEHYSGPAFLYDKKGVDAYRQALGSLMDAVLSPEESFRCLVGIRDEMKGACLHD